MNFKIKLQPLLLVLIISMLGTSFEAQPDSQRIIYFFGEILLKDAQGTSLGHSFSLVKCTQIPAENKMSESRWVLLPTPQEENTIVEMKENQFTLNSPERGLTGTGEWIGPAWKWKEGHYKATYSEGKQWIAGEIRISSGVVRIQETSYQEDGTIEKVQVEERSAISPEAYEYLSKKLLSSSEILKGSSEMYEGKEVVYKESTPSVEVPVVWKYRYYMGEQGTTYVFLGPRKTSEANIPIYIGDQRKDLSETWHGKAECYDLRGKKISEGFFKDGEPWEGTIARVFLSCGYFAEIETYKEGKREQSAPCEDYLIEDAMKFLRELSRKK